VHPSGKIIHHNSNQPSKKTIIGNPDLTFTFAENQTPNFNSNRKQKEKYMFWTLDLASHLEDAPWPATKDELIDFSIRSGAPIEVVENLQELEDEGGEIYEGLEDIWPDYPSQEDFFFNEDEY
jgi:hypothetical protein